MKREAINHTKMRRLARILGIEIWGARGIMESLWFITGEEAPAGDIGKLSDSDIADAIGWQGEVQKLISGLIEAKWLDTTPTYRLVVHDWPEHCADHIHAKLAKARSRFANGSMPKFTKLTERERRSAESDNPASFKLPSSLKSDTCAGIPGNSQEFSGIPTNSQESRENSQESCPTLPYPTLPDHTVPARAPVLRISEFPKTDAAVRRRFPTADLSLVMQITDAAAQAYVSVNDPKIPAPEDVDFAAAVEEAARQAPRQFNAVLFKTTVPAVIKAWAELGRHPPPRQDLSPAQTRRAEVVAGMKALDQILGRT